MSRVFIDITTSVRWRRPPVGIVRVEREFAKYCLANIGGTVFCEVDTHGIYRALPDRRVHEVLDDAWCSITPFAAESAEPMGTAQPPRGTVQKLADWAAGWGPRVVPRAIYPLLRDLGRVLVDHHRAFVLNRAAKRAARARADQQTTTTASHESDGGPIAPTKGDVFFSIGLQWHHGAIHAYRLKQSTGVRVVEFCHDTIPVDHPEHSGSTKQPFGEYFACLAHTANLIATNSDSSRHDLHAFFERVGILSEPALRTVRLASPKTHEIVAVESLAPLEAETLDRLARGNGHVLYVSTFEVRKNHRLLLQLWKDFYKERGDACPTLVLVGMFGWGVDDLRNEMVASDVWASGKIVLLHDVSDALLAHLYRSCLFTVFPSLYEGWGLAANESLAYGKLVIASDAPALREATQGLCPTIYPLDYPRWREVVMHYIDDAGARTEAEARIRAAFVPRHWDEFSREILAAAEAAT